MGRRSSMLVSSAALGRGISQRCFQKSGMCWVGHSVQSGSSCGEKSPVRSLMIRPYCFFSKVVANTAGEYASPELAEDFEEADGPKIFNVGEFSGFGQRD